MKKRTILTIILDSVFVVAFNALFFLHVGAHSAVSAWVCYGFLHFAYLMVLLTPLMESKGKTASLSRLTTYSISLSYFAINFVFALFVFFYRDSSGIIRFGFAPVVSAEIILTVLYIIILAINLLTNDTIAQKQAVHDAGNAFIKTISAKAKYIETLAVEQTLKNRLNDLYATAHASPIHSSSEVAVYERKIEHLLQELEQYVKQNTIEKSAELITEIDGLLTKRNLIVKLL